MIITSKELMMELIGRVLWWSDRDQNGIIVDTAGNEFYFDRSVLNLKSKQSISRKSVVLFHYNDQIHDCLCAHKVSIPTASKKKSYENKFENELIREFRGELV